jgi:antitoxin ParD1/3/4
MNVSLTPKLEKLVHSKVKAGRYGSASEVIREALRLLEQRDEWYQLRASDLRRKIAEGVESLRRGEGADGETVFDRLDARLNAREHRRAG